MSKFKVQDHYFKRAKKDNYVARSAYKLEEIDKKFKLLNAGMTVIDLGYHPGSWIQYIAKKIGGSGRVCGIDIKPVNEKIIERSNISLFELDIEELTGLQALNLTEKADIVTSDMAPNTTGIKSVDQARSAELVKMALDRLPKLLRGGGAFVFKIFDGADAVEVVKLVKGQFDRYERLKPKSTRSISKEFFGIGFGYKNVKEATET